MFRSRFVYLVASGVRKSTMPAYCERLRVDIYDATLHLILTKISASCLSALEYIHLINTFYFVIHLISNNIRIEYINKCSAQKIKHFTKCTAQLRNQI